MTKEGYQPIKKETIKIIPPNTGSHVRMEKHIAELEKENAELKSRIGISVECDKAQKNGELCLGYGGDEDEPCEQCKNCIKCECGYYQLGETEKDEQLTKAKELIKRYVKIYVNPYPEEEVELRNEAEQFLNSEVEK